MIIVLPRSLGPRLAASTRNYREKERERELVLFHWRDRAGSPIDLSLGAGTWHSKSAPRCEDPYTSRMSDGEISSQCTSSSFR